MALRADNISKQYFRKTGEANFFSAVSHVSLTLDPGTLTVLTGRSGSGKTTLLHMLSGLLPPSEGKVLLDGADLYAMSDADLSRLRNTGLSVIPQARSALETLTVLENVLLPGALYRRKDQRAEALHWLEKLGIGHLQDARPAALSGGELRRMAIARALTQDGEILLADEPTGDLDDENTALVLSTLRAAADAGKAVLLVTHEQDAKDYADCVYRMNEGEMQACI
ncbi:MAG: ABC transporter ATP-binding protein [Clostridia bacterium]|nr:ABC transporter ATP-binding protein [Clostridia bacterium]